MTAAALAVHGSASDAAAAGRIGPNAIIRMVEALDDVEGKGAGSRFLERAGLSRYIARLPEAMVDEAEVIALHREVREALGEGRAETLSWLAGRKTADYLLAHRMPKPMRRVLRILPPGLAARVLLAAISRHAWTFAGSGRFRVVSFAPVTVEIAGCPLARGLTAEQPACGYFAATLERLFAILVHPDACVSEIACAAMGAPACRFEIAWR
jgi:divinyl protochlorophyllide a 8-vinyl-reductase